MSVVISLRKHLLRQGEKSQSEKKGKIYLFLVHHPRHTQQLKKKTHVDWSCDVVLPRVVGPVDPESPLRPGHAEVHWHGQALADVVDLRHLQDAEPEC